MAAGYIEGKEVILKYCTNVEQGKEMMRIGLNPNTCDLLLHNWVEWDDPKSPFREIKRKGWQIIELVEPIDIIVAQYYHDFKNGNVVPCWSAGALIELIPEFSFSGSKIQLPQLTRPDRKFLFTHPGFPIDECDKFKPQDRLVDAAYDVVLWALNHSMIEKYEYPKIYSCKDRKEYLVWDK